MNASVTPVGSAAAPADTAEQTGLFWSLQYCRASTLSLTRLELALESGDRQRIIEAMDRLHALDREIERKVASLPGPAEPDPARPAIEEYLGREKMAVAFEKLVLASGISGPGIASAPAWPAGRLRGDDEAPFAVPGRRGIVAVYGLRAALLLAIVAATGAILTMAL